MKNLQGWMILGIACLAGCVGTTIPVQAQQTATAIVVKERLVEHVGDRFARYRPELVGLAGRNDRG